MNADVQELLSRAITRLLHGDRYEFEKLATKAEDKHKRWKHLYVTVEEILKAKRAG